MFAGIGWYLSARWHRGLISFFPKLRRWPVILFVVALFLLLIFGFVRSFLPVSSGVKQVLGQLSGYGMGIFLYLLLFTLAADILLLVPRLMKLPFVTHRLFNGCALAGILLLTMVTCTYGFINGRQIDHVSYEIRMENKNDISDLNMVLISDLHLGAIGSEERLGEIVDEINSLHPDVVCIAGDFFDTDFASIRDPEAAIKTLRKLQSTYGVYTSLGNHDGGQTHGQMLAFLEQADIQLLDDTYTVIDDRLVLVGRLDGSSIGGYDGRQRKEFAEVYIEKDSKLPVIVLDHNPAYVEEYGPEADLILCGHTHKGQVFPGSLITGLMYPVDYGYYRADAESPQVVVTSGIGYWGLPMRVGTNSEIVTLKFCK